MSIKNPVVRGFYPDPSVCKWEGKYYLVCSTMHYFPGIPLFESEDLVNWKQIGNVLTRESQIDLEVPSSGGVFAPCIRVNEGRFYVTTTNSSTQKNFYVWTDDIYGEWSEPVYVEQDGIDPSLYFENGKSYFMSNGSDADGVGGIVQCEINIETGEKLSRSKCIWQGSGGRYLEGPHLYKIGGYYYLVAAEGGTEYGHMVTYARGTNPFGPFENYEKNPVLTNRNLGGYDIQGVGHGDLIEDNQGNWWLLHLGFRQTGQYMPFHHLGREVFLSKVDFGTDGWFTAGDSGTTRYEIAEDRLPSGTVQTRKQVETFVNTDWNLDWCYIRHPKKENYQLMEDSATLKGSSITLDEPKNPTFIGIRQKDFDMKWSCKVTTEAEIAGITVIMDENHHYDIALERNGEEINAILKLNIGDVKSVEKRIPAENGSTLVVESEAQWYSFYILKGDEKVLLGKAQSRYLSSEVATGFTGVLLGCYVVDDAGKEAVFTEFTCKYC